MPVSSKTTFRGFSNRATGFYRELAADNTKQFWLKHKDVYESEVRDPMRALTEELEAEFGPATLLRPYRDTRFSKDKTPYKTYQAALLGDAAGIGCYVQVDANGLLAGGGFHSHSSAQVDRYRQAVDDPATGEELAAIVGRLRQHDFAIEGEQLKTAPRGYDRDHPRVDLLRRKSVVAVKRFGAPDWVATPQALVQVRDAWRLVTPLNDWVIAHVGAA
jgi:uncharacterized protein (TIGR02453 family)